MKMRFKVGIACLLLSGSLGVQAQAPLTVVTSFSILQDMTQVVAGDRAEVKTLVGANEDPHVYQPKPSDSRLLGQADLVIQNGLELKGWMERVVEASGYNGPIVIASEGIERLKLSEDHHHHDHDHHHHHGFWSFLRFWDRHHHHDHDHHHHGEYDPHAWQSLQQAQVYVDNILAGLIQVDPEGEADYRQRATAYQAELSALHEAFIQAFAALPEQRRRVMVPHDAFAYLGDAYGITFVAPQGISTASEPSAAELAQLINQVKDESVAALFMENIGDPRLIQQVERETGARVGGVLYSDALSGPQGRAATYLDMMQHNLQTLLQALEL